MYMEKYVRIKRQGKLKKSVKHCAEVYICFSFNNDNGFNKLCRSANETKLYGIRERKKATPKHTSTDSF
jgi:hypothetical protein